MIASDRNARGVNLGEARVGETGPALVCAPGGGDVATLGVGRQVEDVAVAAGGQDDRVRGVRLDRAGDQIAGHDAAGATVDDHQVEHLGAREHLDLARRDLARQRLVRAQEKLLPGLPTGIEGARHLRAAKGTVGKLPAVLARKGNALGHALVDDVVRDLGQAIDVVLARAEVPALDGVVEQALHAVAVVLVVLGGVDAPLRGDAVRAARDCPGSRSSARCSPARPATRRRTHRPGPSPPR